MLDWLEGAVGRHPTQYLHPMGSDRIWDSRSGRWRTRPGKSPRSRLRE
jgi:hypothetical protein